MATVKELRELDPKELRARAAELEQTLFELRNKHSTGVLDSTADIPKTKREIARILTVARELRARKFMKIISLAPEVL